MSTRGSYGFRLNGKDYVSYNHSDSYPSYLGEHILAELRDLLKGGLNQLKEKVAKIKVVDENTKPPIKDIDAVAPWTNTGVGNRSTEDWYCLLRNMQGSLKAHLESGYLLDNKRFLEDSLFCEWAYIVNLDEEVFEIYKGFRKEPGAGRYGKLRPENSEYFGVDLKWTIPLHCLPQSLGVLSVTDC